MKSKKKNKQIKKIQKQTLPAKSTQKEETWLSKEAILKLAVAFLLIELIGIFVAKNLFAQGLSQAIFSENINDSINGFYLFGMIILTTVLFLLIIKFKRTKKLLWAIEMLAIFSTSLIVFSSFFPNDYIIALLLTAIIFALRYSRIKSVPIRSLVAGIAIMGAGAYIGISLGLIPLVVFVSILSLYDIVAVFFTKHMVKIGQESTQNNFAFTVALPTKQHNFELGNGDLVIPLAIAASVLTNGPFRFNWLIAGLILGMSFLGLGLSLQFVSRYKTPLPALPPQVMLMLITILLGILLGA